MNTVKTLPLLLLLLLTSCAGQSGVSDSDIERQLGIIAVLPTSTSVLERKDISFEEARSLDEGANYVYAVLRTEFRGNPKIRFASDYDHGLEVDGVKGGSLATIQKIGKKLSVDAVLISSVQQYRQRVGGEYSVDTPASAEFSLRLIAVSDGRALWTATFKETQQSLMADLFTFGKASSRGFTWITVEDMVGQGVREKLAECPYIHRVD